MRGRNTRSQQAPLNESQASRRTLVRPGGRQPLVLADARGWKQAGPSAPPTWHTGVGVGVGGWGGWGGGIQGALLPGGAKVQEATPQSAGCSPAPQASTRLRRVKLTFTHQAPWAGTSAARKASCLCPYRGVTVKGHQWEEAGMAGRQAVEAESEKAAPKAHRTFTGSLTRVPPPSSPALAPRGQVRPQSQGRPPRAPPTPGAAEGTSARSKSLPIASVHQETQMGPWCSHGRKVWRAGRASG